MLTEIERTVLECMSYGMSPEQIAVYRQRSVGTVRNQIEDIRYKLQASTNAHAVAIAFRNGMLD